jgi:acyl-CoA synthetase (AMP-forming)/AMP-acid ligase II
MRRRVKQAVHEAMSLELRDVRIVAQGWLAKTTSGKISRSLNRERYLQEQQAARSVAPN